MTKRHAGRWVLGHRGRSPEALVDRVDVRVARLDEADVERLGVAHRVVASDAHQREHEAIVIEQYLKVLVAFADRAQAEGLFEELPGDGHVIDGEI
jgi:hypothetical protein